MPAVAVTSARRAILDNWPDRHRAWLQHLDRVVPSAPQFKRAEGPRLQPFPDWRRHPASPPSSFAAK